MSDFDKEAEREKLREKYGEEEEQRREATEQMSELLLQGATMTNAHCSDCGDPIFRYDGTEFCPTCEKRVDRDTGADADEGAESGNADASAGAAGSEADADDGSPDETAPDPQTVEVTSPDDDARVRFGGPDAAESPAGADADEPVTEADAPASTADATASQPAAAETGGEPPAGDSPDRSRDPPASTGTETAPSRGNDPSASGGTGTAGPTTQRPSGDSHANATGGGRVPSLHPGSGDARSAPADHAAGSADVDAAASESLQQARRTLAATVERFSRRALETDSPWEAREYLETAREAAATLDATEF